MIAVCLLTCNRPELTEVTVRTFLEFNAAKRGEHAYLHCDGGSYSTTNVDIAEAAGFHTIIAPRADQRIGQMACLLHFLSAARELGADWMLWLENDWESVGPIPTEQFLRRSYRAGVDTVRLFGEFKARAGKHRNAGRLRIGTNEPIEWAKAVGGWERGRAHWGGGGTIIRRDVLERHSALPRLKDVIMAAHDLVSLRPVRNLMWTIGEETTKGMIG